MIHSESFSQYSSKVRCTFYITSMETCRPGKKSSGKNLGFFAKLLIKTSNKLDFAIYFHNVFFLSESIAGIRKDFFILICQHCIEIVQHKISSTNCCQCT